MTDLAFLYLLAAIIASSFLIAAFYKNKRKLLIGLSVVGGIPAVMSMITGLIMIGGNEEYIEYYYWYFVYLPMAAIITLCAVAVIALFLSDKKYVLWLPWVVCGGFILFSVIFFLLLQYYIFDSLLIVFSICSAVGVAAMIGATVMRAMREKKNLAQTADKSKAELNAVSAHTEKNVGMESSVGSDSNAAASSMGETAEAAASSEGEKSCDKKTPSLSADFVPYDIKRGEGTHKAEKSGKIQMFFFTFAPSVIAILGLVISAVTKFEVVGAVVLLIIGVLWSAVGAFIIAVNTTGLMKVGPPQKAVLKISISRSKVSAAAGRKYNDNQQMRMIFNVILIAVWIVPVAILGWLLFILYCKCKFMRKVLLMSIECDRADDIIATRRGTIEEIAYYFYRCIDYAYVYIDLNEQKAAKEMLDRAENLLDVWELLYPES